MQALARTREGQWGRELRKLHTPCGPQTACRRIDQLAGAVRGTAIECCNVRGPAVMPPSAIAGGGCTLSGFANQGEPSPSPHVSRLHRSSKEDEVEPTGRPASDLGGHPAGRKQQAGRSSSESYP